MALYGISSSGDLYWYRHDGWQTGSENWTGRRKVGYGGWQQYLTVFSTCSGCLYAVTRSGDLYWYRHNGWREGSYDWIGRNLVGRGGWQDFSAVFATSGGVVYGIDTVGDLYWYRHRSWPSGTADWDGRRRVGRGGWRDYKSVFASSDGVVYGITPGGDLYWYRHNGWENGREDWTGRRLVGRGGWQSYKSVFAGNGGLIYAVSNDGNLYWYRHDGWRDGTENWRGRRLVGRGGWQDYLGVFEGRNDGEISFPVTECIYGWPARYERIDNTVTIRIALNADANVSAATLVGLQTAWANGITSTWSNRFGCDGNATRLTFNVRWVGANAHQTVRVRLGTATTRSNMTTWHTNDNGGVAAHEFGHMLGLPDEYADRGCPSRSPVNTGTIMDTTTGKSTQAYINSVCDGLPGQGAVPLTIFRHIELVNYTEPTHMKVTLTVAGGCPGQRFEFHVEIDEASGQTAFELRDDLREMTQTWKQPSGEILEDLKKILLGDTSWSDVELTTNIVPDSIVGTLTVLLDTGRHTTRFLIDDATFDQKGGKLQLVRSQGTADEESDPLSNVIKAIVSEVERLAAKVDQ